LDGQERLLKQGIIVRVKKNRLCLPQDANLVTGRIHFRQSGTAVLIADKVPGMPAEQPIQIANPIYREVVARVLSARVEDQIVADPRDYVLPDGRLDMNKLLEAFADFLEQESRRL
jgi:hypothetical protein